MPIKDRLNAEAFKRSVLNRVSQFICTVNPLLFPKAKDTVLQIKYSGM